MGMEEDTHIFIIQGRPFLATVGAKIDVKNRKLSLQLREEKHKFNIVQAIASFILEDACYEVDILKKVLIKDTTSLNLLRNLLEACLVGTFENKVEACPNDERGIYAKILNSIPISFANR